MVVDDNESTGEPEAAADGVPAPASELVERMRSFSLPAEADRGRTTDFAPADLRATAAIIGLGVVIGILILVTGHVIEFGPLLDRALAGRAGESELLGYDRTTETLSNAYLAAVAVCGCLWFAWQWRAVRNSMNLAPGSPVASPGHSIGWWFVPFANWVKVPQIILDLVARSAGRTRAGAGDRALVVSWFVLFWVGNALAVATRMPADPTIEQLRSLVLGQVWQLGMRATAALLAIGIILLVQRSQVSRVRAIERAARAALLPPLG
jgi:hypothetical protein